MISATSTFLEKINNGEVPLLKVFLTLADAESAIEITSDLIWGEGTSFAEATSEDGAFTVGAAIIGSFKFSLNNFDGYFNDIDFSGAMVTARLYYTDINSYVTKGTYYITKHVVRGHIVQVTAMDAMKLLDKNYTSITYPTTVQSLVESICTANSITLDTEIIKYGNFVLSMPTDSNGDELILTDRQMLSYACQCVGAYAKIKENGHMIVSWYDFENPVQIASTFDGKSLWTNPIEVTGVKISLGSGSGALLAVSITADGDLLYMRSSEVSDTFTINDNGELVATAESGTTYTIVNEQLIRTGEAISVSENESINILYGTDDRVIKIDSNPYITVNNVAFVCKYISEQIFGIEFRPGTLPVLANPCLQSGDVLQVTDNITGNTYIIPITSTTYTKSLTQNINCAFEDQEDFDLRPNSNYQIQVTADAASKRASTALSTAQEAVETANTANQTAEDAEEAASIAQTAATAAQISAQNANEYASRALGNLATVQSVAETLAWITEHGTMALTTDTALDPTHVYFVVDVNGDYVVGTTHYSIVVDPSDDDLSTYYELSIDESLNNYVGTHLALTDEGLWILPASSGGFKVLIATGNGSTYTDAGTYIVDTTGTTIAKFAGTVQIGKESGRHVEIDNSSLGIFNDSTSIANFGNTVRIGKLNEENVTVGSQQIRFNATDGSNAAVVRFYSTTIIDGDASTTKYGIQISDDNNYSGVEIIPKANSDYTAFTNYLEKDESMASYTKAISGVDGMYQYMDDSYVFDNYKNHIPTSKLDWDGYLTLEGGVDKMSSTGFGSYGLTYYQSSDTFDGYTGGWCHYIIANHGDGENYYHYTIGLPFWGPPIYKRQTGSTSSVTNWYKFITSENFTTYAATTTTTISDVCTAATGFSVTSVEFAQWGKMAQCHLVFKRTGASVTSNTNLTLGTMVSGKRPVYTAMANASYIGPAQIYPGGGVHFYGTVNNGDSLGIYSTYIIA